MTDYKERLEFAYELRGLQANTRRAYTRYVRKFSEHHDGRAPEQMGSDEVATFLEHLSRTRALGPKTLGVCWSALAFYYRHVERRPEVMSPIPRRKQSRSMPVVLSVSEVEQLLSAIRSPKVLAVSMVMYGSGLRVSEACALRVDDIDSKRDVLRVRDGKGGHDRYTLLGARLLTALRTYWKRCRPPGPLLFPNRNDPNRPMTREGVDAYLKNAARWAGLSKKMSPHVLSWAPDGSRLATTSKDGTTTLWDAMTGAELTILQEDTKRVHALAWAPNGTRIATANHSGTTLWDAMTGEMLGTNVTAVSPLAWRPDGICLATATVDGSVNLWMTSPQAQLAKACEILETSTGAVVLDSETEEICAALTPSSK